MIDWLPFIIFKSIPSSLQHLIKLFASLRAVLIVPYYWQHWSDALIRLVQKDQWCHSKMQRKKTCSIVQHIQYGNPNFFSCIVWDLLQIFLMLPWCTWYHSFTIRVVCLASFFPTVTAESTAQLIRLALFCSCFSHGKFPDFDCAGIFYCGEGEGKKITIMVLLA